MSLQGTYFILYKKKHSTKTFLETDVVKMLELSFITYISCFSTHITKGTNFARLLVFIRDRLQTGFSQEKRKEASPIL